ncbi:hypothetical protein HBE96_25335 [Clostridium sp. P21]|uniref:Uncharacterized protein n=1 Tax=Clostridium muellerianum TaxID=2716538 RepID=A0A7Y0ELX8_9CLOT|nr:hypothetical protein [Clostridium muellerianum]
MFARKNKKEILAIFLEAADELKQTILLSDNLEEYIKNSLPLIAVLIENAAPLKKYTSQYAIDITEARDNEKMLYDCLQSYVASLPAQKQLWMDKAVEALYDSSIAQE